MIKFTSIVVVHNEDTHLDECLGALDFCDENIVILLDSSKECAQIAKNHGHTAYKHKKVPIVEEIREWAVEKANNDWIIFIDPDEVFPENCIPEISALIKKENNLGEIRFPKDNYFIGYKIKHGQWGGNTLGIFNKNCVNFSKTVHQGITLKKGSKSVFLKKYSVKHYWIDSMEQFYEKHNRYLEHEGERKFKLGNRYSVLSMYTDLIIKGLWYFIRHKGFLDFSTGWRLLKLGLWYEKNSWLSLKKYQSALIKK